MIGHTISHYKILEKLGEGGMGIVYKAEDTKLDRLVALKFLPEHLNTSDQDKARFVQEAKAASAINHPNICTIYSIEEHESRMFIVMEFVDGQTLRERKDALSFKQSLEIATQIADGLAAAHEKGIVHRDIKPENIMLRKDGIAQIMDFGLAKLRASGSKIIRLTKEGSTVGTAGYMSPEQIQGQDADHRSDIFSFGVLLYELLTGQLPFRGVHETALAYEIVNVDPQPMSSIKPEIDPTLDAIVLECLEKDPNERSQSIKQVSLDLKRLKRESSKARVSRVTATRPVQKIESRGLDASSVSSRLKNLIWPTIASLLGIALMIAVWKLTRVEMPMPPAAHFDIHLPNSQTLEVENHPAITISPDGSVIVYKANGRLYRRNIESLKLEEIPGTEDATNAFFSPDSRWLGFFSKQKLVKIPLNGGSTIALADVSTNNRGATWAKDGTIIFAASGRGGLSMVRQDGGEVRQLTVEDTTQNERTHRWPQCLPDGKTVIFTIGTLGSPDYYEDATIGAVNIQTGERKEILKGASTARYIPTGHLIYSHSGTLFAVPFDPDKQEVSGSAFPVTSDVSNDVTTGATHFACSETGTLVYIQGSSNIGDRTLSFVDLKGNINTLPAPAQSYVDQRISPDGNRIAVAIQSGKDFDIWVDDIQRNTMTRLTFGGSKRSPIWSPDGKKIAYSDNTSGPKGAAGVGKVVIIRADGGGVIEEISLPFDRTYVTCWSRDGSKILVTVPQAGKGWDIWVLPLTGDKKPWPFLSTRFDEAFASLSPDGKWLAYVSNETVASQAYVRPFPHGEGKWQVSTNGASKADWSSDGKTLYFGTFKEVMSVSVNAGETFFTGIPKTILKDYRGLQVESAVGYDITPDGNQILISRPKDTESGISRINVVTNWFAEINKAVVSGK
jgi:serine/threonine-protein kinase